MPGAEVQSLVREWDPTCHARIKDPACCNQDLEQPHKEIVKTNILNKFLLLVSHSVYSGFFFPIAAWTKAVLLWNYRLNVIVVIFIIHITINENYKKWPYSMQNLIPPVRIKPALPATETHGFLISGSPNSVYIIHIRLWCWERLKAGKGDDTGWDCWMVSLTQWFWARSRSWWWTGKPGVLQSMGSQRVGDDRLTEQQQRLQSYIMFYGCMRAKSLQWCLTLGNPMDYSPPGSSVHGILQARIPERVAIFFPRLSSQSRD